MPWHANLLTRTFPSYKRSQKLGMTEGGIIGNHLTGGINDTFVVSADVLYAVPLYLPETIRVFCLNAEVTVLNAGNMRMGLYRDGGDTGNTPGYPSSLVVAETEITTLNATGIKRQLIQKILPCGFYWGASVFSVGTPLAMRSDQIGGTGLSGLTHNWLGHTATSDMVHHSGISVAHTYAALPDPFTAGATLLATETPRVVMVIGKYGVLA